MTHVLFWAALMDQEEEAQVVIPDLEDEDVLGSCFDATLNNGFSSPEWATNRSAFCRHLGCPAPSATVPHTVFLLDTHFHKQAHSWKAASFSYSISHCR